MDETCFRRAEAGRVPESKGASLSYIVKAALFFRLSKTPFFPLYYLVVAQTQSLESYVLPLILPIILWYSLYLKCDW